MRLINRLWHLVRKSQIIQSYKFLTTIMQMYKLQPMFRNYKYLLSPHAHDNAVSAQ